MPGSRVISSRPIDHLALCGESAAPALVLRDRTLDFAQLGQITGHIAGWLAGEVALPAAKPGARVASWAGKDELTCLMPLAAARAGLVHVPINPLLKRAQVAHILADSGAKLLIANSARLQTLAPDDIPAACTLIDEEAALERAALSPELQPSNAAPDDLAAILYTSGSTGRPKGVMLSHANLWLGAHSVAEYLGLSADDRTLAVLPLSFDYGQNQLFSSWFAGGSVVPLDYLTPRDVIKAVERHRINTLAAVPPLWVQLCEVEWPHETAARLHRLTNSGGALTPDLVQRLRTMFPQARVFAMYGLTEAFRSTYLDPALIDLHPTSIGRAIPHAEVLVIDEHGEVAADGAEGELVHCGPLVAQGYWNDAGRTRERFRPAPAASRCGGLAVWSGDRVRRDLDGLLHFVGRRDAMIKSGGYRISPQEIEEAALATGLVAEAVVLGVPDTRLGAAIHLIVRAPPGALDNSEDLRRRLLASLPNFMQPHLITWRNSLPLGPKRQDRSRSAWDGVCRVKPLGPTPAGFGSRQGVLTVSGTPVTELVEQVGETPLFVYSANIIAERVAALRRAMPPRLAIHYAVKANPYPPILHFLRELVDGFDIASAGELAIVHDAGIALTSVSFAGPGKRDAELAAAINAGVTLNLESENEAARAVATAERLGVRPRLAIRVNPELSLKARA